MAAAACVLVATVAGSAGLATAARADQPLINEQLASAVAFDGTNYLVVWQGSRDAPYRIYGSRVSRDGTVIDGSGIEISDNSGIQTTPAVAYGANEFLVVWEASGDIHGALVTHAGIVVQPAIVISGTPNSQRLPAVAFDGTNFLVTWQDDRTGQSIYGARVGPGGSVLDPNGIPISGSVPGAAPAVAFDGTNYLVVWHDLPSGPDSYVYGARVSRGGSVLDATPITISSGSEHPHQPSLAFDGTNYFVVWQQGQASLDIYGARVSPAGAVLDPSGVNICNAPGEQQRPKVVFAGSNYLVAWDDARSGIGDIYQARVSPGGIVLDPCGRQVVAPDTQIRPALAFDGTNALAVWEDSRLGNRRIFGTRMSQDGIVLDPNGILISTELPPAPPPPPPPDDTVKPHVHALKSTGKRGRMARLRYRAWDNSKITREAIVVFSGHRPIAAGETEFSRSVRGVIYAVRWRVPRKVIRKPNFCVLAEDRAGNRSGVSCAKIVIN